MEETQTSTQPKSNKGLIILLVIISMVIGASLLIALISLGYINSFMTDEQCSNITTLAYQQGIVDVANFTTMTGNFTYIFNNTLRTKGVQDYCIELIQSQGQQ